MDQEQYFAFVQDIEQRFPVAGWNSHGVPVWPIVRIAARSETLGVANPEAVPSFRTVRMRKKLERALSYALSPIRDPLRNLGDWDHEVLLPHAVDALFLGDGVSLDCIEGVWRDRYCAPIMEALETGGHTSLLMQPTASQRLPRGQATLCVNWIDRWGRLLANALPASKPDLPGHGDLLRFLKERGLELDVFQDRALESSGARVAAMARLFDFLLARARPKIVFIVNYYHEIGYALCLACRRRGILSVDIQHGGQNGNHEAYNRWLSMPPEGYSVLPGLFWNWDKEDTVGIDNWVKTLSRPWHRSLWAGHPQLAPWLDDSSQQARHYDSEIARIGADSPGTFDILVALQDLDGFLGNWNSLADFIAASPPHWRWWLRRHPSPAYNSGSSLKKILSIERPGIFVEEASTLPLPALLRNVDAVITMMSSTAFEAQSFGHRTILLTEYARALWPQLVTSGKAEIIVDMALLQTRLQQLEAGREQEQSGPAAAPPLAETLSTLLRLAGEYKEMVGIPLNRPDGATPIS